MTAILGRERDDQVIDHRLGAHVTPCVGSSAMKIQANVRSHLANMTSAGLPPDRFSSRQVGHARADADVGQQ